MDGFDISALRAFNNPNITDANAIINKSADGGIKQNGTYTGVLSALSRSKADKAANNEARTLLLQSLGKAFGMEATVNEGKVTFSKEFMDKLEAKLGKDFKRSDFGINTKGEVTSGKPLTQRRITAICAKATEQAQHVVPANDKPIVAPEVVNNTGVNVVPEQVVPQPPVVPQPAVMEEQPKVNEDPIPSHPEENNLKENNPEKNNPEVKNPEVKNPEENNPVKGNEAQNKEEVGNKEVKQPEETVVVPSKPSRAHKLPPQQLAYLENFIKNADKESAVSLPDFQYPGYKPSVQQAIVFCHILTASDDASLKDVFTNEKKLTAFTCMVVDEHRTPTQIAVARDAINAQEEENGSFEYPRLTAQDRKQVLQHSHLTLEERTAVFDEETRDFIHIVAAISKRIDAMHTEGKQFTSVDEIIDLVEEYFDIFLEEEVSNDAESSMVESNPTIAQKGTQKFGVDSLRESHRKFLQELLDHGEGCLVDAINYKHLPQLPENCYDTSLAMAAAIYLLGALNESYSPRDLFDRCGKELMLARAIIVEKRTPEMLKELVDALDKFGDNKSCLSYYHELMYGDPDNGIPACGDVPQDYKPQARNLEDALAVIPNKYHDFIRAVDKLCTTCVDATSLEEIMACVRDAVA